jgi:hypothetical protein
MSDSTRTVPAVLELRTYRAGEASPAACRTACGFAEHADITAARSI